MLIKKMGVFAASLVLMVTLAACGSNNASTSNNDSSSTASDTATAAQEIVLKATNFQFDQPEYKVKKGEAVKFTLETDGVHSAKIGDTGVDLKGGESKIVTINDAGTFEIRCNVPCGGGHADMVSKLIVE